MCYRINFYRFYNMFFLNKKDSYHKLEDWKFELILDNNIFDISKKVRRKLDQNLILDIKESFDFKKLIFQNKINYKKSYLRITNKKINYGNQLILKNSLLSSYI